MTIERARLLERVLRSIGAGALLLALLRSLLPSASVSDASRTLRIDAGNANSSVSIARVVAARASALDTTPVSLIALAIPSAATRAVLGAATAAHVPLRWYDSTRVRAFALDASTRHIPHAATVLSASSVTPRAAPSSAATSLVLRDQGGVLDSTTGDTALLRVSAAHVREPVRAEVMREGKVIASATAPSAAPVRVRNVLLFAQPGWDAKFVTAALEESGWTVEGSLTLSPTARTRLGAPALLDTARYSAVVVLDSGVASSKVLDRFLTQGGGAVLSGEALRDPSLQLLSDVRIAAERPAIAGALLTDEPRRGLPAYRLRAPSSAVVLEREGEAPLVTVARRRVGRVLVSGYRASWRWRMQGRDESADAHRRWWTTLVGAVAAAADTATERANLERGADHRAPSWPGAVAPVADLVARIGPASRAITTASTTRDTESRRMLPPLWLLYITASLALLAEWALRRLRGAP